MSLCRLLRAPAGSWPFPTLSMQSLRRCLDPYPAVSFQCTCSLLPGRQRPHLKRHRFGTPKILPAMQLQQGSASRGCSHSFMFRLPRSLDPQIAPTAEALCLQGSQAVTPRIARLVTCPEMWHATYPTRATDTAGLSPAGLQPCRLLRRSCRTCTKLFGHYRHAISARTSRLIYPHLILSRNYRNT